MLKALASRLTCVRRLRGVSVGALWLAALGVVGVGLAGARSAHPDGVSAASSSVGVSAAAGDGTLDPGFGRGGKVLFATSDEDASTTGLLLASGGRLLLGGWVLPIGGISIAQLTGNGRHVSRGTPDSVFPAGSGDPGLSAAGFVGGSGGTFVTAGKTSPDDPTTGQFVVVRFRADRQLDRSFGGGGSGAVITDFPGPVEGARAVVRRPGGSVAAGGFASLDNTTEFALAAYTADGALDSSFGAAGTVVTSVPGVKSAGVDALVRQGDGKFLAIGSGTDQTTGRSTVIAARYLPDGALDSTFGDAGITRFSFRAAEDAIARGAMLAGGRLVIVGATGQRRVGGPNHLRFAVARLSSTGAPDPSFASHGIFVGGPAGTGAYAAVANPNSSVVAAGGAQSHFVLLRLTSQGKLDGSFGRRGIVQTTTGGAFYTGHAVPAATALLRQPNGYLVAAGSTSGAGDTAYALMRYTQSTRRRRNRSN